LKYDGPAVNICLSKIDWLIKSCPFSGPRAFVSGSSQAVQFAGHAARK
jgi:hypothetical protein